MPFSDGNYNGEIYVGNVKWSNDYKHVMKFASKAARTTFLKSHLTKLDNAIAAVSSLNGYIDVDGKLQGFEGANYVMFKNDSDFSGTYFCCFITDFQIIAEKTTRLFIQLDVFQQYFYDTEFFQSFIERAIISKAADNANTNYLPEPVSAPLIYEHELQQIMKCTETGQPSNAYWMPLWVLHSASYYNSNYKDYQYAGIGTENTYGEYGRFIHNRQILENVLKFYGRKSVEEIAKDAGFTGSGETTWQDWVKSIFTGSVAGGALLADVIQQLQSTTSIADLQDHRDELIGLYAIPTWLYNTYQAFGGDTDFADNRRVTAAETLTINASTLANGYTPRNKKLLTSVCRAYVLMNYNGLQIPFKPELFNSNSPMIRLSGITMSTGGYHFKITNYDDYVNANGEVSYNSERRVGYDANTGINKALSILGAGAGIAGGAASIVSGNPAAIIGGASAIGQNLVSAIDSLGTREQHFGNNGDLLRITGDRAMLRWMELNPSVSECQAIDNFFDMYGYTIQKHQSPTSYMSNRSNWNYLKTETVNLTTPAPANYEQKLKDIFDSGVTLWHSYSTFGDYSQSNS